MAISPLSVDTRYCELGFNPYTSMWGTTKQLNDHVQYGFFGYEYDHIHFANFNNKSSYQWLDDYKHPTDTDGNGYQTFFRSKGLRDLYATNDNPSTAILRQYRSNGQTTNRTPIVTSPAYSPSGANTDYSVYMNSALNFAPVVHHLNVYRQPSGNSSYSYFLLCLSIYYNRKLASSFDVYIYNSGRRCYSREELLKNGTKITVTQSQTLNSMLQKAKTKVNNNFDRIDYYNFVKDGSIPTSSLAWTYCMHNSYFERVSDKKVIINNDVYTFTGDGFWIYIDTYVNGNEPNKPYINEDCILGRGYRFPILKRDIDNTSKIITTARATINNGYTNSYNRGIENYNNLKSYLSSISLGANLNAES